MPSTDFTYQENYFSMTAPGIGRFLVAMALQGFLFMVLLFLVELQCVRTFRRVLGSLCRRHRKVRLYRTLRLQPTRGCVCRQAWVKVLTKVLE